MPVLNNMLNALTTSTKGHKKKMTMPSWAWNLALDRNLTMTARMMTMAGRTKRTVTMIFLTLIHIISKE